MSARRTFLKTATLGAAALALPSLSVARPGFPRGKLCVLVYGHARRMRPADSVATIVAIDLPSFEVRHVASRVSNLHGLFAAGPGDSELWGIGHESLELLEVYDRNLELRDVRRYPGIRFRGHGIAWRGGLLVAAERKYDPMAGGLLLHLDTAGRVLAQFPSGGLRPHDIVATGGHFAVAHYGNRLKDAAVSPTGGPPIGAPAYATAPDGTLRFDTVSPGVAFLRQDTLELAGFHRVEGAAATSHLGATADGQVMAMSINTMQANTLPALHKLAERDGATLLPSEWYERGYETYAPMVRVDPRNGVVGKVDEGAARMRRGQSFSHDSQSGVVVATYAASQTLYVQVPGQPDRWLSTPALGVPNPRGCALLPGTPWVAISGNDDNVALVDVHSGQLEKLVGVPLGGHSHMFWLPS